MPRKVSLLINTLILSVGRSDLTPSTWGEKGKTSFKQTRDVFKTIGHDGGLSLAVCWCHEVLEYDEYTLQRIHGHIHPLKNTAQDHRYWEDQQRN